MKIYNYTVNILSAGENYLVQANSKILGEAGPVILKEEAIWSLQPLVEYHPRDAENMVTLGKTIYKTLFPETLRSHFKKARAKSREEAAILRILLKFSDEELHKVPWELMHDGHRSIALDPVTPIVRYIEQRNPVRSMRVRPPLRVLFTTACPQKANLDPLDLEAEERSIVSALKPYQQSKLIELSPLRNVSLRQLHRKLIHAQERNRPFHIWHHCGHGTIQNTSFSLALDKQGHIEYASTREIAAIIKKCPMLRLAIFNVCYGGALEGLAPGLAAINVPATIGFRDKIKDSVALDFTRALYDALLSQSVDMALKAASRALFDPIRPMDWALPLLFLRTRNASLLKSK